MNKPRLLERQVSFWTSSGLGRYFAILACLLLCTPLVQAQTTVIGGATNNGNFEAATFAPWVTVNQSPTVGWFSGAASVPATGTKAAYHSIDGGVTYNYNLNAASASHFYQDVSMPVLAGTDLVTLSFALKGIGETGWDRLLVYTAPTSVTPVAANPVSSATAITGATLVYTQPAAGSGTAYSNIVISLPNSLSGTTFRLIFTWQNDGSGGTSPGASVDDVSLTYGPPANFVSTLKGGLWSNGATWVGGISPPPGNDATIVAGSTVTVDQIVNVRNLSLSGNLNLNNGANTTNTINTVADFTINATGNFYGYTSLAATANGVITVAGDFINNGYADLANCSVTFNGSTTSGGSLAQTLRGTGIFQGDGTKGLIRQLNFLTTGNSVINTTNNLCTANLVHTAGTLNTNGKLEISNTRGAQGTAYNTQVSTVAVTNMGTGYVAAPVAAATGVVKWPLGVATAMIANARYTTDTDVYIVTVGGTSLTTKPTHTAGTATNGTATLLWIGTAGTIGNSFLGTVTHVAGTQYWFGNNLYTCVLGGLGSVAAPPIHTTNVVTASGVATFRYVGTPCRLTANWDVVTGTLRSFTVTQPGVGYLSGTAPLITIAPYNSLGTGAAALSVVRYSPAAFASSTFQKSGQATITGGLTINSSQGVANTDNATGVGLLFTTNGGVNYTVAPQVGISGPSGINLVTNAGSGYTAQPTITVTGGTLISGVALTTSSFIITVLDGKVTSVYLSTPGTSCYSVPPTLAFSTGTATLAFPAGCWATANANLNTTTGQVSSFTVTNAGYGYVTTAIAGVGPTSGTAQGGTFSSVATAPLCLVGAYGLTLNYFAPASAAVVNVQGVEFPANGKLQSLTLAGNGAGLNLSSNISLYGATPFSNAGSGNASVINLGGFNLKTTWNGYAGAAGTNGLTPNYIKNGSMTLTGRGGPGTYNFPFSGTFTWYAGTQGALYTTGNTAQRITVTQLGAPTDITGGSGSSFGNRTYRVQTQQFINGVLAPNTNTGSTVPYVTMNFDFFDGLTCNQNLLYISQAAAQSGPWMLRNNAPYSASATVLPTVGVVSTSTVGPAGPVVYTGDDYFAWSRPAPLITSFTPATACGNSGSVVITGTGFLGASAVTIGGTPALSYTVNSNTQITALVGSGTTGNIIVTVDGLTATSATAITVLPSVSAPTVTYATSPINPGDAYSLNLSSSSANIQYFNQAVGGVSLATYLGTDTYAGLPGSSCVDDTLWFASNNGSCLSARTQFIVNIPSVVLTATPLNKLVCTVGGSVTLSATNLPGMTYAWSPSTGLSSTTSFSTVASPTTTTAYNLNVTNANGCSLNLAANVGVLPASSVTPSATPASGCFPATTSVQLNSNLVSSGFGVGAITYSPAVPSSSTPLVTAGSVTAGNGIALSGGTLDDGGWANIPLGFNYNFFGTVFNNVAVGTNGLMMFGPVPGYGVGAGQLGQYAFIGPTVFPNAANPGNVIAACAMDLHCGYALPAGNTVRYWTDGIAPTRRFILEYKNVSQFASLAGANLINAQIMLYETTGIVEIHMASANSLNAKTIGLQDVTRLIGATAPGRSASTVAVTVPEAWRFQPPANYTYAWTPATALSATNITNPVLTISAAGTQTRSVSVTNPITGCASPATPVSVVVSATPSAPTISGTLTVCGTGSTTLTSSAPSGANVIRWYNDPIAGTLLNTGTSFTTPVVNATTTYYVAQEGACSSARTPVIVTWNPSPLISTLTATPPSVCYNTSSALYANAVTPAPATAYSFAATSGTYTPLGGTKVLVPSVNVDDAVSAAIPLGFNFTMGGVTYSNVYASSNGYLSFNSAIGTFGTAANSLAGGGATNFPLVAPLWDDLDGTSTGEASYLTTGSAPNRVFTFQWSGWEWNYLNNTNVISFQVKLYEATDIVQFVYLQGPNLPTTASASIGIATLPGEYVSLQDVTAAPTVSSSVENGGIATRPATGQVYTFTPPVPVTLTYNWTESPAGSTLSPTSGQSVNANNVIANKTYTVSVTDGTCSAAQSIAVTTQALTATASASTTGVICIPTNLGGTTYYLNNFSTTGGVTNISNLLSGLSAGGYGNFTAKNVTKAVGGSVNFAGDFSGAPFSTFGVSIFVDWNQDEDFADAGETVYQSLAYVASTSGSITVPATALNGNCRMRVAVNYLSTTPTSCESSAYQETEDFTFIVTGSSAVAAQPCPLAPWQLSVVAAGGGALAYSWAPATGLSATNIANPIANPNNDVTYTVTVTDACGGTTTSSVFLDVQDFPNVTITNPKPVVCGQQVVALTAVGGNGTSYVWSPGTGLSPNNTAVVNATVTATTTYSLTASVSATCFKSATTSFTFTAAPALTLSTPAVNDCVTGVSPLVTITSNIPDFNSYVWSPSTGVTGTAAAGYVFDVPVTGNYTLTSTSSTGLQCQNVTTLGVLLNPNPLTGTATFSANPICNTSPVDLFATGFENLPTILTQDFETGVAPWTITAGSSAPIANWNLSTHGVSSTGWSGIVNSPGGSKFILADSDGAGIGSTTNTQITSPAFSLAGYSAANLQLRTYVYAGGTMQAQISINGGATWPYAYNFTANTGTPSGFTTFNIGLAIALGNSNCKVRFNYVGSYQYVWAIDDIVISGTPSAPSYAWTGPSSFTSAVQNPGIASVAPANAGVYTVRATNAAGCLSPVVSSAPLVVNLIPSATISGAEPHAISCETGAVTVGTSKDASGSIQTALYTNGTISWSVITGNGTITSGGSTLTPTYQCVAADRGTLVRLRMSVQSGLPCVPATADYVIDVRNRPVAVVDDPTQICVGNPYRIFTVTSPEANTTYAWSTTSDLYTDASFATPYNTSLSGVSVYAVPFGTVTYNVTATNTVSGCVTGATPVTVSVCSSLTDAICSADLPVGAVTVTNTPTFVDRSLVGASLSAGVSCSTILSDIWFKAQVPYNGEVHVYTKMSTNANVNLNISNALVQIFTGASCATVSSVACNTGGAVGGMAYASASGLTPGSYVYIRLARTTGSAPTARYIQMAVTNGLIWTGAVNSDFSNPENYLQGDATALTVPSATSTVIVPANASNVYPVVTGTQNAHGLQFAATFSNPNPNVTISSGAELRLTPSATYASFINRSGFSVSPKINGTGTLRFNEGGLNTGSILCPVRLYGVTAVRNGVAVASNGNMRFENNSVLLSGGVATAVPTQNYNGTVTGNIVYVRSGSLYGGYNYWSSPVASANTDVLLSNYGNNIYQYVNTNAGAGAGTTVSALLGWTAVTTGTGVPVGAAITMTPGKGFIQTFAGGGSVSFTGAANQTAVSIPTTVNGSNNFNLLGNPYPSALSYDAFKASNPTLGSVYLWSNVGATIPYAASSYVVMSSLGLAGNSVAGFSAKEIGPAQGFLTNVSGAGSINFSPNHVVPNYPGNTTQFLESNPLSLIRLRLTNPNQISFDALVGFGDTGTEGADFGYDSPRMPSSDILELYSLIGEQQYTTQFLPNLTNTRVVDLGAVMSAPGTHKFVLAGFENFDSSVRVYLEDALTGEYHNMSINGAYSFTNDPSFTSTRFRLHFMAPIAVAASGTCLGENNGKMIINNPNDQNAITATLRNDQGVVVGSSSPFVGEHVFNNLPTGSYGVDLALNQNDVVTQYVNVDGGSILSPASFVSSATEVSIADAIVEFSAEAQGASQFTWNFGDGVTLSGTSTPVHAYTQPGIYTVTLTASNGGCESTVSSMITVTNNATGIADVSGKNGFSIYPNPANEAANLLLNVDLKDSQVTVSITDATGRLINKHNVNNLRSGSIVALDINGLANGVYEVTLDSKNFHNVGRLTIAK